MDLGQAIDRWVDAHADQISLSLQQDVSAIAATIAWLGHGRRDAAPLEPIDRKAIARQAAASHHSLDPSAIDEFLAIVSDWATSRTRQRPATRRVSHRERSNQDTDPNGIRPVVVVQEPMEDPFVWLAEPVTDPNGVEPVITNEATIDLTNPNEEIVVWLAEPVTDPHGVEPVKLEAIIDLTNPIDEPVVWLAEPTTDPHGVEPVKLEDPTIEVATIEAPTTEAPTTEPASLNDDPTVLAEEPVSSAPSTEPIRRPGRKYLALLLLLAITIAVLLVTLS